MPDYPKPDGYVGSGPDGNIMRTGTGGRISNNEEDPSASWDTDSRRNPADINTLPGE
jgi:hypothetical protein